MSIHPLHADIGGRPALEDPAHLAALREEIFATRGADAPALLYALGFVEGMVDGLRVAQAFAADDPRASLAGPGLPLLFAPGTGCERARVSGVLEMSLEHPRPITPGDLLVTAGFNLARIDGELKLLQVEPAYEIALVQRGVPKLTTIDTEAFGDGRIKLVNPIVAAYLKGAFTYERVRYLIDPNRPAQIGTQKL